MKKLSEIVRELQAEIEDLRNELSDVRQIAEDAAAEARDSERNIGYLEDRLDRRIDDLEEAE